MKKFPYVNGGLFAEKNIEIPKIDENIRNMILDDASGSFNWSGIFPTIFGAIFESTLNPQKSNSKNVNKIDRNDNICRKFGIHYTSIENIHKVIDPLFLDDLKEEFEEIKKSGRNLKKNLLDFQQKLAGFKFFYPACGSGNFLTATYICIRELENEILRELLKSDIQKAELGNPVKVSINNFY